MTQPPVILASASPRRKELLGALLPEFSIMPADIPEDPTPGEDARAFALRLSVEKARSVSGSLSTGIVIGADTIVTLGGRIFGKPDDTLDAAEMLRALSGSEHVVITAFTVIDAESGRVESLAVESRVIFKTLTDEDIASYLSVGESMDKAGAYAVQGAGRELIKGTTRSMTNIIGLPLKEVGEILSGFGVKTKTVNETGYQVLESFDV